MHNKTQRQLASLSRPAEQEVVVKDEDVPVVLVKGGGEAAVEEGAVLVHLVLRRIHLLHFLHLLYVLLWPQVSAAKILQQHEHKDKLSLQYKWVPKMMHRLVIDVVGMRATRTCQWPLV